MSEKTLLERLDFEGWFWRQKENALAPNPDWQRVARNTAELFEEAAVVIRAHTPTPEDG